MQLINVLGQPNAAGLMAQTIVKGRGSPTTIGLYCLGAGKGYVINVKAGTTGCKQTQPAIADKQAAVIYYVGLVTQLIVNGANC